MINYAEPGLKEILAAIFITIGTSVLVYDLGGILRAKRSGAMKSINLIVKCIRILTTLLGISLITAGGLYGSDTLFVLGIVIGLEELYETTLVLTAIKYSKSE